MKIIRSKAHLENNINWNPRVGLEPPDNLRHQVFPWLQNSLKVFENHPQFDDKNTARLFLTLLEQLQTVVIQDAAALAVRFPTRMKHKLFELPVFQSVAFSEYTATMRATLDQSIAPWDASLEQIMPGLNTRFNSLQSGITANSAVLREITNTRIPQLQKECNNIRPGVSIEFDKFRRILNECFQANAAITSDVRHSEDGLTSDNNTPVMYNASPHSPNSVVPQGGRKNPYPGYGYKLPSVNRASELWFAWFGEGLFKDKPIPGGIDQLIKKITTRIGGVVTIVPRTGSFLDGKLLLD